MREAAEMTVAQPSVQNAATFTSPLVCVTLVQRADFVRLNRGRKYITPFFILRSAPTPQGVSAHAMRVGFTVTTKCGGAVVRNRIKRRLRALVRTYGPTLGVSGMDYNFIARADVPLSAADAPAEALQNAVIAAFKSVAPCA